MSYVHPAWLEHQRQRFTKPEPIQRKTYTERLLEERRAAEEAEEQAATEAERKAIERSLLEVRRELAEIKMELVLRRLRLKANFNPDQPRVPKGEPDGGQWTREGGDAGKEADSANSDDSGGPQQGLVLSDASPDPIVPGAQYAQARIEIDPQILTGEETIDRTTIALSKRLANVVDAFEILPVQSGPVYGRLVHETLKLSLRLFPIPGVKVEPTLGGTGRYGSDGSVRPDVSLENDVGDTLAYYDYKTGGATVKSPYADKVRRLGGGSLVPVIQLSVTRGSRMKSWTHRRFNR